MFLEQYLHDLLAESKYNCGVHRFAFSLPHLRCHTVDKGLWALFVQGLSGTEDCRWGHGGTQVGL